VLLGVVANHVTVEHRDARAIVRRLGYLPLAIAQAGAYLSALPKSLAGYLDLLDRTRIEDTLSRKPGPTDWHYQDSVFTTWEASFEEIRKRDPKAAEILTLCAFVSNDRIQPEMLERGLRVVDPSGTNSKLISSYKC
jgi:hypothetical protein